MKFAIAVVMLALALAGVQSSVVPWPYVHGPVIAAHHGPVLAHTVALHPAGISLSQGPAWGHHVAVVAAHHAPALAVHAAPAHAAVLAAPAVHVAHGHEGSYVAKTRGAVHTAPLAGHVASVSSVNVAPAPGTH